MVPLGKLGTYATYQLNNERLVGHIVTMAPLRNYCAMKCTCRLDCDFFLKFFEYIEEQTKKLQVSKCIISHNKVQNRIPDKDSSSQEKQLTLHESLETLDEVLHADC